jgi:hypothetical protein
MYTRAKSAGIVLGLGLVLCVAAQAHATKIIAPNGGFERDSLGVPGSAPLYTQTITDWTVGFTPDVGATFQPGAPLGRHSGVFNTFSLHKPFSGNQFFMMNNLGVGTVSITGVTPFRVDDQFIAFQYVYASHDRLVSGGDQFRVIVDFFTDATMTTSTGSLNMLVHDGATRTSTIGQSPFGGTGAIFTYASGPAATQYVPFVIPVQAFFNNFARLTFVVDNVGPVAGSSTNGIGLTGVLIDNILLTPEPSSIALLGLGILGLGGMVVRRRRKATVAQD